MTKEFIPYEQALALKELGFNEKCAAHYLGEEDDDIEHKWEIYRNLSIDTNKCVQAPTFSQAFRWFREKHNLMFQIFYLCNGNYAAIIHRTTPEYMDLVDQVRPSSGCVDEVVDCYSYEEAELECLKNLIEIVKNK